MLSARVFVCFSSFMMYLNGTILTEVDFTRREIHALSAYFVSVVIKCVFLCRIDSNSSSFRIISCNEQSNRIYKRNGNLIIACIIKRMQLNLYLFNFTNYSDC